MAILPTVRLLNSIYYVNVNGEDRYCFDYWTSLDGKNTNEWYPTLEQAKARQFQLAGYNR